MAGRASTSLRLRPLSSPRAPSCLRLGLLRACKCLLPPRLVVLRHFAPHLPLRLRPRSSLPLAPRLALQLVLSPVLVVLAPLLVALARALAPVHVLTKAAMPPVLLPVATVLSPAVPLPVVLGALRAA